MPGTAKSCIALLLIICLLVPAVLTSCKKDGMNLFYETPPGDESGDSGTPAANTPSASVSSATPAATGTMVTPGASTTAPAVTTTAVPTPSASSSTAPTTTSTTTTTTATAEPAPPAPLPIGDVVAEGRIAAATGGTFTSEDGSVTLTIPPGALQEDTTIQVRQPAPGELPSPEHVYPVGPVYDFQPDGLVLSQPAILTYRLPAETFSGLNLAAGEQPLLVTATRSGDGTWEFLAGTVLEADVNTGEVVLTSEMNHFCTPVILATPVRAHIYPTIMEGDVGESWFIQASLDSFIDSTGLKPFLVEIANAKFDAGPRLSVETGSGDLFGLPPLQPGESLTLVQGDANRFEAAGDGYFSATITLNLPGTGLEGFFDIDNWILPPAPQTTATLPTDFYRPQVTDTAWIDDLLPTSTGTVTIGHIRPHAYEWGPLDEIPELPSPTDTGLPFFTETNVWTTLPTPTPTPTRVMPRWGFWQMLFLAATSGNLPLVLTLRGAFICRILSGGIVPCFAPDTLVLMADGSAERIADIQPGEMVVSWDEDAGQYVTGTVSGTGGGQADYYYLVNGGLRVTPPHPFYVTDRGWTKVADLRVGDTVLGPDGPVAVTSIELVNEGQPIANITVSGYGNYFVSADGADFFLVREE